MRQTPRRKALDALTTLRTCPWLRPLWDAASRNFARGAAGQSVDVFHSTSRGVRIGSTWATQEYPILMQQGSPIIYHLAP